jgi:hypothetical protein
MAKVIVRYIGPEAREFGGKIGTEKFHVPSKADKPDRAFEVSREVADVLATVTGGGKFEGKPLYEVLDKLPEAEAEVYAEGTSPAYEPPVELEAEPERGSFSGKRRG